MKEGIRLSPHQLDVLEAMSGGVRLKFRPLWGRFQVGNYLITRATADSMRRSGVIERAGERGRDMLDYVITPVGYHALVMRANRRAA